MRTALISALKRTGEGILRAEETIAGRALLDWQVDLAADLGCERIICLCEGPSAVVIAQQQRVETAGLAFHTARGPLQLAGLVRDEDVLVLQLDGLFVSTTAASDLLMVDGELCEAVWTLPASRGLSSAFPEDFERIDREQNWAGLAVMPGECVSGLADLPGDGDAYSLLLRLALQARTQCKPLPAAHLESDDWFLVSDQDARERRGAAMMASGLPKPEWAGLANAIANKIVRRTAPHWLQSAPEISAMSAIALGMIGVALASLGNGVAGVAVASLGAFAAALSKNAREMRSALGGQSEGRIWSYGFPIATIFLAIPVLVLASVRGESWLVHISLPIFALAPALIVGQDRKRSISAFWRDTPLHLLFFAAAASLGYLQEGLIVFGLAALLQLALRSFRQ